MDAEGDSPGFPERPSEDSPNSGGESAGTCAEFRKGALVNAQDAQERDPEVCPANAASPSRDMAVSFLRLANLDNELIDRLSRS